MGRKALGGLILGGLGVILAAVTLSDCGTGHGSAHEASDQYDADAVRVNKAPS